MAPPRKPPPQPAQPAQRGAAPKPAQPPAATQPAPPPAEPGAQRAADQPEPVESGPLTVDSDVDVEPFADAPPVEGGVPQAEWVSEQPIDSADFMVGPGQTGERRYADQTPPDRAQMLRELDRKTHTLFADHADDRALLVLDQPWDAAKHPRAVKGTHIGGEFISAIATALAELGTLTKPNPDAAVNSHRYVLPDEGTAICPHVEEAMGLIDSVINVKFPHKPKGKVRVTTGGGMGTYGVYQYDEGLPTYMGTIHINEHYVHPLHTTGTVVHETGHSLDHASWPGAPGGHYTSCHPEVQTQKWKDLLAALYASQSIQNLRAIRHDPSRSGSTRHYAAYLTNRSEEFARAFEQYIAIKTGDQKMLESIAKRTKGHTPSQWTAEDYAPIYTAMENLFKDMGWLVPTT